MMDKQFWSGGVRERLQTAVRIVARGKDNCRARLDKATRALVDLQPEDFPARIRGRAAKILAVRGAVAEEYETDTLFHFERLTQRERDVLLDDLLSLYEACLLDLGADNEIKAIYYPADR
jgi:hypothetical protein